MKRFFTILFVAIMTTTVFAQFSGSGSGTAADPYLIFNPIQLDQVRNYLNRKDVYFKMMADIDLEEFIADNYPSQGWLPIGNSSTPFKGVFDGNGKKITHLTINRPTTDYVGFFAYTAEATIKSLTINDAEVKGGNSSAVLAGKLEGGNANNITILGNVEGGKNTALLSGEAIPRYYTNIKINTIKLKGNVDGTENCGLLLGYMNRGNISNICGEGEINGQTNLGGIAGKCESGTKTNITSCDINLKISGISYIGGIAGYAGVLRYNSSHDTTSISNMCINIQINATGDYVGGIFGKCAPWNANDKIGYGVESAIRVRQSFVGGCIYTRGNYVGGLVGEALSCTRRDRPSTGTWNIELINNYFIGTIEGSSHVAGLVGDITSESNEGYDARTLLFRNYTSATIVGRTNVGGLAGNIQKCADIRSNISISSLIRGDSSVGRIYGKNENNNVTIGTIGSSETNKALTTTKLIINGNEQTCEDDLQNGQSTGNSVLKYKASYQGVGWDFSSIWAQQETESYPYFQWQTAPPVINKPLAGATTITGKGTDGALIEVQVGSDTYQTVCNGNTWSVTTMPLSAGSIIYAMATEDGKSFSYRVTERVQYQGNGTEVNPYLIHNAIELANVNGSGYYKVMNDIDASSINPWIPIGQSEAVNANIDGSNFTIRGLNVNSDKQFCGLIANTQGVTLKNINLQISSFNGGKYSGGLVGVISEGTIHNCHIIGDVQGGDYSGGLVGEARNTPIDSCSVIGNTTGSAYTGGLAGCTNANITDCSVEGNVSGTTPVGGLVGEAKTGEITKSKYNGEVTSTANNAIVGGLVGNSYANISECYSVGTAQCAATGSKVGGLVGVNNDAKTITNCYSTSTVTAEQNGGGLVGYNYGAVSKCYAQGNVTSTKIAGGMVGYNDGTNATVQNCFAMNQQINATSSTGIAIRVIGGIKNSAPTPEMNNYVLKTMAVSVNGVPQTIYDDNLNGLAKTDVQLKQLATFSSSNWDMTNIWGIEETQTYPYLKCHTKFAAITFQNYDGMVLQSSDVMLGITPAYTGETPIKAANVQYSYTFKGWNPIVVPAASDAIYTAEFDSVVNKYLITFRNADCTELKSEEVEYGLMPIAPADPTKESTAQYDYTFAGWTPAVAIVTQAATYTATYTSALREYLVTFLNEDNTVISSKNYKCGETPVAPVDPVKQNTAEYTYTFNGWDNAIAQVQGPQTYKATFTATKNSYTITWQDENGSLINKTTVEYGVVPTHADPVKQNTAEYTYTFAGWTPSVVAVTGDATYKATFNATKNSYTITWQNEDGSLIDQTTVEYGVVPTHANPTKLNTAEYTYTFAGWTPAVVAVTGNTTYKATFSATKNSYTITWQDENGSLIDQTTVEYGQIPAHADPVKLNTAEYTYTFAGWTPAVVTVTGDATYKATFTATKNSYTITWQNEDGSLIDQTTVEYGVVPTHADPVKQNTAEYTYTFAGWTPAVVAVTGNATYKATFSATKNSYTITWQDENGSLIDQTTVEYGQIPAHADPVKQNTAEYTYTFAGWTPTVVAVTGNATYRATFTATKNKYLITFRNDDGTVLKSEEVEYGMLPIAPATPTKESTAQYNYEFAGWTPSVTLVSQAATYTATYNASVREYLVTFLNDDNSIISMQSCKYGSYPTIPSTPTKQATAEFSYTFAGWTPNIVAVSGDVTYKATFNATKNSYTITWKDENGALIDQTIVEYGQIPAHADPVKLNTAEYTYTFAGWTPAVVAVTGNATYKATFSATKNSYTITWQDENGSLIDQTTVEYGQIPAHADPVKQNTAEYTYTFAGWTPAVVAVTGNATYKATFLATKNSYTITWQNEDGSLIDQTTVEYGQIPAHADPVKQNTAEYTYTFAGWTPTVVAVTGDATYKATFTATKNSYTITWQNEDGSLIDQTTVEYGVVPTHAEPTKEATEEYTYTFTGWTPAVVAVTGDATYTATFSSVFNVYTISVSAVNGQVIGGGEYQYGATIDLTAIPNEGYVFDQWSDGVKDNPRTITVTGDAEYTALFTSTEGFENIYTSEPVQKVIIDQKVYILRGEKVYTLQGQEVK